MRKRSLGILSLDTNFPRIVGDVGNPNSYPCPVHVAVVEGADSPLIVKDGALDAELVNRFVVAAQDLEKKGVSAIISTCGFLFAAQNRVARAVKVPVMLSALSLAPQIIAQHGGRIGIVTASSKAFGASAVAITGLQPHQIVWAGLEHIPAFAQTFLVTRKEQPAHFDSGTMEAAVVGAATALLQQHRDISALLLECGNLPPYADAIRCATGLPVHHLVDAAPALMHHGTALS